MNGSPCEPFSSPRGPDKQQETSFINIQVCQHSLLYLGSFLGTLSGDWNHLGITNINVSLLIFHFISFYAMAGKKNIKHGNPGMFLKYPPHVSERSPTKTCLQFLPATGTSKLYFLSNTALL